MTIEKIQRKADELDVEFVDNGSTFELDACEEGGPGGTFVNNAAGLAEAEDWLGKRETFLKSTEQEHMARQMNCVMHLCICCGGAVLLDISILQLFGHTLWSIATCIVITLMSALTINILEYLDRRKLSRQLNAVMARRNFEEINGFFESLAHQGYQGVPTKDNSKWRVVPMDQKFS